MNLPRLANHRFKLLLSFNGISSYDKCFNRFASGVSCQIFRNLTVAGNSVLERNNFTTDFQNYCNRKRWVCVTANQLLCSTRLFHLPPRGSHDNETKDKMLPPLMPFPFIVWPKLMNSIRNWFFINFIIKPYFDKDFSMNDFLMGAKEAISVVSNKLSEGKFDDLEGLVERSALSQIRDSVSKFTVFQQQLINVAAEDVFFAFPYQIGIIIPDDQPNHAEYMEGAKRPPQTRHVEITVCLHVLRGLAEKQRRGETASAFNFTEFTQDERNKYNVMICNYRFFKDFTEGSPDPSWIINVVNHFLPAEGNR